MTYKQILYRVNDGIATITLNRPERLNAWTPLMGTEIYDAMSTAAHDKSVRVIIFTGTPPGFCGGLDNNNLSEVSENTKRKRHIDIASTKLGGSVRSDFSGIFTYFPTIGKPIIAVINGPTAGSGLVFALCCDLRFAATNAIFTTSFARRGLTAEHGIDWILPRFVGVGHAQDLLLSARKISAEEALRIGLVNQIFPQNELMQHARNYAAELINFSSPRSMRIIKRQVWDSQFVSLAEAIEVGNKEMLESFHSNDFQEGIASYKEKRSPCFTDQ